MALLRSFSVILYIALVSSEARIYHPKLKLTNPSCHALGQRALVGKCNMDRNCPSHYIESSPSESINDTRSLIDYLSLPVDPDFPSDPLVKPCITPRFAISCSDTLLEQLGRLAAEDANLAIQTHMSENTSEIDETLRLFPGCETYTEVYKKFGLLRRGTILAHCVHMSDEEMKMIKECEAGISHCPTSNLNLMSGGARVGAMLDAGIDVSRMPGCHCEIGSLTQVCYIY
jgi:guanine deaminase